MFLYAGFDPIMASLGGKNGHQTITYDNELDHFEKNLVFH